MCNPGYYLNASKVCEKCPPGYYCQDGVTKIPCPVGKYASTTAVRTECHVCPPGQYQPSTGKSSCVPCPAGTAQNTQGQTACISCGAGTFSSSGASTCSACDDGFVQSATGQSACVACSPGTYSDTQRLTCLDCGVGYACLNGKSANRSECFTLDGKYSNIARASSCFTCPDGCFASDANNLWYGKYIGTKCRGCLAGRYCKYGLIKVCPKGQYQPAANKSSCIDCAKGTYQSSTGQTACINCAAMTYSSTVGAASCTNCAKYKYSAAGASICTNCSAGCSACTSTGACKNCLQNYHRKRDGSAACIKCPANTSAVAGNFEKYCWGPPTKNAHCPSKTFAGNIATANFPEVTNGGIFSKYLPHSFSDTNKTKIAKYGACMTRVNVTNAEGIEYLDDGVQCASLNTPCCWNNSSKHNIVCNLKAGIKLCEYKSRNTEYEYTLPTRMDLKC